MDRSEYLIVDMTCHTKLNFPAEQYFALMHNACLLTMEGLGVQL